MTTTPATANRYSIASLALAECADALASYNATYDDYGAPRDVQSTLPWDMHGTLRENLEDAYMTAARDVSEQRQAPLS